MKKVFSRPSCLKDKPFRYCPGCSHGVLHRIVAEAIDHLGIRDRTIGIAPVGCAVFAYDYLDIDMVEVPHGRPPAIATGMKRSRPDAVIFSYQGDGDLAAIGTGGDHPCSRPGREHHRHLRQQRQLRHDRRPDGAHYASRPENNDHACRQECQGSGQSAQSLRNARYPGRSCYIERVSVDSPKNVLARKRPFSRHSRTRSTGKGFSLVEVLPCVPTDWGMTPVQAVDWVRNR